MRNILFIINPRSGKRNSESIIAIIKNEMPASLKYDIHKWNNLEEFKKIETQLQNGNYTDAVAVGGDGSVNLTGSTILNKNITLGIIPSGSGNGLARSLGLSMNIKEALQQIITGRTTLIDTGTVNDIHFFCTSGVGFDAHIGHLFAHLVKRGLKSYIKIILKEFSTYKPKDYTLIADGKEFKEKAFLITVANAGQYGNNFYIAPEAKMNDGMFHVVVLKSINLFSAIGLLIKILRFKAHTSALIATFTCRKLTVIREQEDCIHFDGEPKLMGTELNYKVYPKSLKVIVGDKFKI